MPRITSVPPSQMVLIYSLMHYIWETQVFYVICCFRELDLDDCRNAASPLSIFWDRPENRLDSLPLSWASFPNSYALKNLWQTIWHPNAKVLPLRTLCHILSCHCAIRTQNISFFSEKKRDFHLLLCFKIVPQNAQLSNLVQIWFTQTKVGKEHCYVVSRCLQLTVIVRINDL